MDGTWPVFRTRPYWKLLKSSPPKYQRSDFSSIWQKWGLGDCLSKLLKLCWYLKYMAVRAWGLISLWLYSTFWEKNPKIQWPCTGNHDFLLYVKVVSLWFHKNLWCDYSSEWSTTFTKESAVVGNSWEFRSRGANSHNYTLTCVGVKNSVLMIVWQFFLPKNRGHKLE